MENTFDSILAGLRRLQTVGPQLQGAVTKLRQVVTELELLALFDASEAAKVKTTRASRRTAVTKSSTAAATKKRRKRSPATVVPKLPADAKPLKGLPHYHYSPSTQQVYSTSPRWQGRVHVVTTYAKRGFVTTSAGKYLSRADVHRLAGVSSK